jgi:hypothetical protein
MDDTLRHSLSCRAPRTLSLCHLVLCAVFVLWWYPDHPIYGGFCEEEKQPMVLLNIGGKCKTISRVGGKCSCSWSRKHIDMDPAFGHPYFTCMVFSSSILYTRVISYSRLSRLPKLFILPFTSCSSLIWPQK